MHCSVRLRIPRPLQRRSRVYVLPRVRCPRHSAAVNDGPGGGRGSGSGNYRDRKRACIQRSAGPTEFPFLPFSLIALQYLQKRRRTRAELFVRYTCPVSSVSRYGFKCLMPSQQGVSGGRRSNAPRPVDFSTRNGITDKTGHACSTSGFPRNGRPTDAKRSSPFHSSPTHRPTNHRYKNLPCRYRRTCSTRTARNNDLKKFFFGQPVFL